MNRLKLPILILLMFLESPGMYAQKEKYIMQLVPETWPVGPSRFYISAVKDNQADHSSVGELITRQNAGKSTVVFPGGLENSMLSFINSCMKPDTSKVPMVLAFDQFRFSDQGTFMRHTVTLDFKCSFQRVLDGNPVAVFEIKGKPQLVGKGVVKDACENLVQQTMKQVVQSFDKWSSEHFDQAAFCKKIVLNFVIDSVNTDYDKDDTIRWLPNSHLQWKYFLGSPGNSPFSAQSGCSFEYGANLAFSGDTMLLNVHAYATFAKKSSWVKADMKMDVLLAHEQLHFDICELYIRKLRKKMQNISLTMTGFDSQLKQLFDETWKDYQQEQNLYDEETRHGSVEKEQQRWKEKIAAGLKE